MQITRLYTDGDRIIPKLGREIEDAAIQLRIFNEVINLPHTS